LLETLIHLGTYLGVLLSVIAFVRVVALAFD
jgi:hypothetical protein